MKKLTFACVSVLVLVYFIIHWIHAYTVQTVSDTIPVDEIVFDGALVSVDEYLENLNDLWFVEFKKVKDTDVDFLLISSTLIIGRSSCRVKYQEEKLTGEFGCLRQTPMWFLDEI